jgi:hypothetical protein
MKSRRAFVVAIVVSAAFYAAFARPQSVHAADASAKCEAARLRMAAQYSACLLKAEARAQLFGGTPDFSKCDEKSLAVCTKIETKYGDACPTQADCIDYRSAASCAADQLRATTTTTKTTSTKTTSTTTTTPPPPCPVNGSGNQCQSFDMMPQCQGCCLQADNGCGAACTEALEVGSCNDSTLNDACTVAINEAGCSRACDCG